MKKEILLTAMLIIASCGASYAMTGREVMDRADALKQPDTVKAALTMKITKGKSTQEKEFNIMGKKAGKDEKVLIMFTKPTRIKFLTHTHKKGEDDQWLMMSSGKVKRIAAGERTQPFVNSHFYYEDMKSRDIDSYNYKLTGEAKAAGFECYKVEATPKGKDHVYSKAVFYARKSDCFIVRADIYKDGSFLKYIENYDIKNVSGILTPYRAVMKMADGKGNTELKMKAVQYNRGIPESRLSKESLR
ncbi:MAG TPA: outer membrane lipoprotein-sorting protein [Spirochaetota bacterium]|mgnify:CR=1 FL=1|nr:outer membrane lipoprotein-sorting protein [Spirochaetota bacterium]HPJ34585.1 outer membrane lipoprotein-sorting protein [Spirochaetota bacterium]